MSDGTRPRDGHPPGIPAPGPSHPRRSQPERAGLSGGWSQPARTLRPGNGGDGHRVRRCERRVQPRAGERLLGPGRAWPDQHRRRIRCAGCPPERGDTSAAGPGGGGGEGGRRLARPGAGPALGAGHPTRMAAGGLGRGQRAADWLRRAERPPPLSCPMLCTLGRAVLDPPLGRRQQRGSDRAIHQVRRRLAPAACHPAFCGLR